ncbi:MAG: hypothetical protein LC114_03615 [Bryobacterales bacterium]|nr:hypothetical protein [Bryobacterales bacterium]
MIFTWDQILPSAVESLPPLHQEIVMYLMAQPGKKRLSYAHAMKTWGLDREQFDRELGNALGAMRRYLRRLGLRSACDLELR